MEDVAFVQYGVSPRPVRKCVCMCYPSRFVPSHRRCGRVPSDRAIQLGYYNTNNITLYESRFRVGQPRTPFSYGFGRVHACLCVFCVFFSFSLCQLYRAAVDQFGSGPHEILVQTHPSGAVVSKHVALCFNIWK